MFSRSTGETDDLLGAPAPGGAASGASRGRLTVHRGQLYFGDPSDAASSASEGPYPPPAASSGRRYQGGVAFDETYVDITDASEVSSSDGEYSYVETGSGSESRRQRAAARADGARRGPDARPLLGGAPIARTSSLARRGFGAVGAVLAVSACAVLVVVGLVASGAVDANAVSLPDVFRVSGGAADAAAVKIDPDIDESLASSDAAEDSIFAKKATKTTAGLLVDGLSGGPASNATSVAKVGRRTRTPKVETARARGEGDRRQRGRGEGEGEGARDQGADEGGGVPEERIRRRAGDRALRRRELRRFAQLTDDRGGDAARVVYLGR